MKFVTTLRLVTIFAFSLLAACGGGGGGGGSESTVSTGDPGSVQSAAENIEFFVAGLKGPLAFADMKVYAFDPSFPKLYDRDAPLAEAISDQYAQISRLSVRGDIKPPFILTIGGDYTIDLNTGKPPVIAMLTTAITRKMLDSNQPVYATPLTTLAFHMARNSTGSNLDPDVFVRQLETAGAEVSQKFALDQDHVIDIFVSPAVINDVTDTLAEQEDAVYHRAAIEAFAAKIYTLSVSADNVTTNSIIDRLALDLQSDGIIDNADNGVTIGAIDPAVLGEDPMELVIPNTRYRVKDTTSLMEDERIQLGTAATGPFIYKDQIVLPVAAAPAITPNSFPVNLQGAAPEEATVVMNVNKPTESGSAIITLAVFDADYSDEGELIINGNTPIALFGPTATASNDKLVVNVPINTPADYWNDGDNTLVFRHTSRNGGFSVQSAEVSFQAANPVVYEPVITLSTASIQFGNQDIGGVAGPKVVKLTNSGNASLTISDMSAPSGFLETNDCNNYLPTGSTCTINVSFVPTKAGNTSGALVISGDSNVGTYRVNLSGTGNTGITPNTFPVNLQGAAPEEATVVMNVNKPAKSGSAIITLAVFDADYSGEGELIINGNTPVALFGPTATASNDKLVVNVPINTPASYWNDGDNTLVFRHTSRNGGFSVQSAAISFQAAAPVVDAPVVDVVTGSSGQVLNVNFNNHPIGPYTKQDAIDDFDADQSTGPGWTRHTNDSDVVRDPTGDPKRGNVMRVTHVAGKGGGGPRFKGRLPVKDEYYLSYDVFIPKSNELMKQEKMPGLIYGSMLNASHAYQAKPVPEGVLAFLVRLQLLKPGTYQARGNTNQLTAYVYDAERVQYNRWFNLIDPVNSPNKSTWSFPKGRWVKVELRVKQNTATSREGVGDRKDGILQTWIDGKLTVDRQDMRWRTVNTMHIDGLSMYNYYGGDPRNPENKPSKDQYTYFDNFIASTSPITH